MGRPRKHTSDAEKQRTYRQRRHSSDNGKGPVPRPARPRQKSRPERLRDVEEELRDLADGYQYWLDSMPPNLSETELAERLTEIVAQLETLADSVADLDPPRGFGR